MGGLTCAREAISVQSDRASFYYFARVVNRRDGSFLQVIDFCRRDRHSMLRRYLQRVLVFLLEVSADTA